MKTLGCQPNTEGGQQSSFTPPFLEAPQPDPAKAAVHLLPVPMEATVSYGGGTAKGPRAILEASFQLELYDREFDCEPGVLYGVHTLDEMVLDSDPATALSQISRRVADVYSPKALFGVLGGEHSLTYAVVEGLLTKIEGPLTIVQIDAHADLRDTYEDTPHSHACVARRLLELDRVETIAQIGIRSICTEEAEVIRSNGTPLAGKTQPRVRTWFTEDVYQGDFETELRRLVRGKNIYLTVDVDGFDPTLIPATGTPEPDGLSFRQGEQIFKLLAEEANLVAFDCVELAPIDGHHASDFVVAKLVYRLMNTFLKNVIKRHMEEQS
jgi:agmatinase